MRVREREEHVPEHLEASEDRLNLGEVQSAVERKPTPDIGPCAARGGTAVHLGKEMLSQGQGEAMEKRMTDLDSIVTAPDAVHGDDLESGFVSVFELVGVGDHEFERLDHRRIEVREKAAQRPVVGVPQANRGAFSRQGQPVR